MERERGDEGGREIWKKGEGKGRKERREEIKEGGREDMRPS